jgi:hypothetical protein
MVLNVFNDLLIILNRFLNCFQCDFNMYQNYSHFCPKMPKTAFLGKIRHNSA